MKKNVILILFFIIPMYASSYNFKVDNIYYNIINSSEKTVEVTNDGSIDAYTYEGDIVIPSTVTYNGITYTVTQIGHNAFDQCSKVTSVIIPNTVTSIGYNAFRYSGGRIIAIPESVKSIEWGVLEGTRKTAIIIPSTTRLIEGGIGSGFLSHASDVYCYSDSVISAGYSTSEKKDFIEATLHVPASAIEKYRATVPWCYFGTIKALPTFVTITMNQYGSATFCSEYPLDFTAVYGLKAYTATGYNNEREVVTMTRVNTAKREIGLFLKGNQGTYDIPIIESSADNMLNLLVGTLKEIEVDQYSGTGGSRLANYKYTILAGDTEPQFYQFEENSTLSAGKAYLQLPISWLYTTVNAIRYRFDDEEDTTDIPEFKSEEQNTVIAYDLMGRRVKHPQKGSLYIINGKKVVY
jgi:hypothetical protein